MTPWNKGEHETGADDIRVALAAGGGAGAGNRGAARLGGNLQQAVPAADSGAVARITIDRRGDLLASLWTTTEAALIGFICSADRRNCGGRGAFRLAAVSAGVLSVYGLFSDGADRGHRAAADDLVRAGADGGGVVSRLSFRYFRLSPIR